METFSQPKLPGYRQLDESDAAKIGEVKLLAIQCGELVEKLKATPELDQRWVSIGATDLQKGFMALVRSIAQPTTF